MKLEKHEEVDIFQRKEINKFKDIYVWDINLAQSNFNTYNFLKKTYNQIIKSIGTKLILIIKAQIRYKRA